MCKGFADATEKEIKELNFYCQEHNTRAKNMLNSKGRKQKVGNSSKNKENEQQEKDVKTRRARGAVVKTRGGVRGTGGKTRGGVQGTGVKSRRSIPEKGLPKQQLIKRI